MPLHLRKQIRDAAAAALTGLTTSGARVFESRTHELQDTNLPGLRIYTNNETAKIQAIGRDPQLERELELAVEACSKKSSGLDDELDLMIQEVEVVIAANQNLGGANSIQLVSIEIEMVGEAEKEIGVARMTFMARYYAMRSRPDVAL